MTVEQYARDMVNDARKKAHAAVSKMVNDAIKAGENEGKSSEEIHQNIKELFSELK